MMLSEYPTTAGHTSVVNNLCLGLTKLGYRTAIGAFKFTKEPPQGTTKVVLNKLKLIIRGVDYLRTNTQIPKNVMERLGWSYVGSSLNSEYVKPYIKELITK